jgi:hypothetical protein
MKKLLRIFFCWLFAEELKKLDRTVKSYETEEKRIRNLLGNIDVSVDFHRYSRSWAVISIQGQKTDYIKFVDLGESEIRAIQNFLRNFDRSKVDCSPMESKFFKIPGINFL